MSEFDMSGIERQNAEFDALTKLTKQWSRLQMTPVVDDDYPAVRAEYEAALRTFMEAIQKNGRRVAVAMIPPTGSLTLETLRQANASRVEAWHGINDWSVMEWGCAMAGEAGEACNVAKKIKRVETGIFKRKDEDKLPLKEKLAEECADTLIYLDLMCQRAGVDLAAATPTRKKFNAISQEYGFPERI
jgi:NTP pyrophosphatase (non-canonical NTP hydrolase)